MGKKVSNDNIGNGQHQALEEFNSQREGLLDEPSSSVAEVAAAAVTGGRKAVKEGGPHRHYSVLGKLLGTWPVGHAAQGK
jgi:hypothetical protein